VNQIDPFLIHLSSIAGFKEVLRTGKVVQEQGSGCFCASFVRKSYKDFLCIKIVNAAL
jgi:hypothetical protein